MYGSISNVSHMFHVSETLSNFSGIFCSELLARLHRKKELSEVEVPIKLFGALRTYLQEVLPPWAICGMMSGSGMIDHFRCSPDALCFARSR